MPPVTGKGKSSVAKAGKPVKVDYVPYESARYPADERYTREGGAQILNMQHCECGHDRLSHFHTTGEGLDRVIILNCPNAGQCGVKGCKCCGFRFSNASPVEGQKRRQREVAEFACVPPFVKG